MDKIIYSELDELAYELFDSYCESIYCEETGINVGLSKEEFVCTNNFHDYFYNTARTMLRRDKINKIKNKI